MNSQHRLGNETRTFWTIWTGQAFSLVGSQASQFALVWWLTLETGSPAVLSTATLVALLPSVVLGPAIGALVDRWSRRLTMIVADSAVALGSLVLAGLFLTGRASTAVVLLFVFLRGINLFLVPAFALLPLLVLQELRGNAGSQAWLMAAFSAGTIGGGLVLGVWGGFRSRVRTALAAIVGLGVATLALGATPAALFPLGVAAMFVVGSSAAVVNGSIGAVFQATVAPEYQGRVFTLMTSVATAMTPVGLLLATPVADLAGVRAWYLAGGMACTILGAAAFLVRPILEMECGAGSSLHHHAPSS